MAAELATRDFMAAWALWLERRRRRQLRELQIREAVLAEIVAGLPG